MRQILGVYTAPRPHWVGDGFQVRPMLSHHDQGAHVSPFILLDYAGPTSFEPTTARRGVGQHPHKGFETVTIVYDGEVEHRDSTGAGGVIGPGDVQWMTAARGIVHEEFHSEAFAKTGGAFEMAQLWVNLPAKDKSADPGYQTLLNADIPAVALPDGAGTLRAIAGSYGGVTGPARTFTPINIWDVRVKAGKSVTLDVPEGHTLSVLVLSGSVTINGQESAQDAQTVLLGRDGGAFSVDAQRDAKLLVLSGEPIDEPVVAHGPFVMNTVGEIKQAMLDFQHGRFGTIGEATA
ncbi:quercetin 2,3-dioxygenase [Hyphomicrobium nitrativorans NL23]|uniref:Quercetin 2,3-dioxygenase n=1 Tax=Hyphomicrobium nitrativorans NL23 TaxID=1029756 RepID=V5SFM4_9HYPH|nr:pirin family protein [Hyphomicrobium nitrativorans]AHB49318.1 quercetin 2,3-dioxygenase [Hyphomicrobium nitrativorans NL23]